MLIGDDAERFQTSAARRGVKVEALASAILKAWDDPPMTSSEPKHRGPITIRTGSFSKEEMERLRKAAEARGTDLAGLATAVLKVCAAEPSIVDAIIDDKEDR